MKPIYILVAVAVIAGIVLYFISDSSVTPQDDQGAAVNSAGAAGSVTRSVELVASDNSYSQNEIMVRQGDVVQIILTSEAGEHDFRVDGLDVASSRVAGGDLERVVFEADTAGVFEYYSSVGGDRAAGVTGTLTVVAQ